MIRSSIPSRHSRFSYLPTVQTSSWSQIFFYVIGTSGKGARVVKLDTHLHLVLGLTEVKNWRKLYLRSICTPLWHAQEKFYFFFFKLVFCMSMLIHHEMFALHFKSHFWPQWKGAVNVMYSVMIYPFNCKPFKTDFKVWFHTQCVFLAQNPSKARYVILSSLFDVWE
jgi:hypothetical protein